MGKKKICFVAQFPPPMHGLSKAVDTLYNSELAQEFEFEKIDITNNRKIIHTIRAIRNSKADLFYFTIAQSLGGNLRDLMIFKAIDNRPCLIHLHGGYYRTLVDHDMSAWQRKENYKAVGKIKGAIVLGRSLKWIFEGMLPDERIFTVPNCVDDEYLMSDKEFDEKLSSLQNRKIRHVLYLSNFIRSKGYPEVLKMAKLENNRGGDRHLHFDFAGKFFDKEEEDYFWRYVRENNLEECITYHGIVAGDKKRKLLKLCDIFVLLTRYPNEGQPISILEAMGNGMCIITTDHAGIPDIVDSYGGYIFSKNTQINDIYETLLSADIRNMALHNREKVKSNFREFQYLSNVNRVWHKLMKGNTDGI